MRPYQINELEKLTGIKAHTIRIWEKRYNLISPLRTDTNRRYYSDDEVRKLLNVSTLLSKGYKISKIAAFTESEINDYIKGLPQQAANSDQTTLHVNSLLKVILSFDEVKFDALFTSIVEQYGFHDAMVRVIYPFLIKVGVLWSAGESEAAQEHFATCIIRRKIAAAIDALPVPAGAPSFLLFLPEGEWHDTGLLFAQYIIRSRGFKTTYLGQNLQIESLLKSIPGIAPQYLLLFYISPRPLVEVEAQLKVLGQGAGKIKVLVAGNTALFPPKKSAPPNVTYLKEVNDILQYLR